jgi:chaperonin GroEL
MMEDISALTGATYFNSTHGDHIGNASFADLGHVAKVSVYSDEVVIVNSESKTDDALVAELIAGVRDKIEQERNQKKKEHYLTRLSNLNGKVARIRVGGRTDLEQKEVYDRVEDAVSAVRSALKEGIVPGGGKALYHVSQYTDLFDIQPEDNQSMCIAKNILRLALIAPLEQIIINSGSTFKDTPYAKGVLEDTSQRPVVKFREGLNVEDDSWGDLVDMGVIDPMAVTRHALENAVAVACTIISTNAIITLSRSVDRSEQPVIMER